VDRARVDYDGAPRTVGASSGQLLALSEPSIKRPAASPAAVPAQHGRDEAGARYHHLQCWHLRMRERSAVAAGPVAAQRHGRDEARAHCHQLQRWEERWRERSAVAAWQRAMSLLSRMIETKPVPDTIVYNAGMSVCKKG